MSAAVAIGRTSPPAPRGPAADRQPSHPLSTDLPLSAVLITLPAKEQQHVED